MLLRDLGYLCEVGQLENVNTSLIAIFQIMGDVGECLPCEEMAIMQAGFCCLKQLSSKHYANLKDYMPEILEYTPDTAEKKGEDSVVNQALEFWNAVCEKELDEGGTCLHFTRKALPHLMPILLQEQRHWFGREKLGEQPVLKANRARGLQLISKLIGEEMVDYMVRFIFKARLQPWTARKTWDEVMGFLLDDASPRIMWILFEILNHFPVPRDIVWEATWEKIINVVGESIETAHVEQAFKVLRFFTDAHHDNTIGLDSILFPTMAKLGNRIIDMCFKREVSVATKTNGCQQVDSLLKCLTNDASVRFLVMLPVSHCIPKERKAGLGTFRWEWYASFEDGEEFQKASVKLFDGIKEFSVRKKQ